MCKKGRYYAYEVLQYRAKNKKSRPARGATGCVQHPFFIIHLQINTILKAVVFNTLAIPFSGGTGTKHKCYDSNSG